jgi:hypothetical protein
MNIYKYKKIILGISFFLIVSVGFFTFSGHASAAATDSDATACIKSMSFVDIAHITCNLADGTKVTFTDRDPTDSPKWDYAAQAGIFCDSGAYIHLVMTHHPTLGDAGSSINAELVVSVVSAGHAGCNTFSPNPFAQSVANTDNISVVLKGNGDSAASLDGVTGGALGNLSFARYNSYDPDNNWLLYSSTDLNLTNCTGKILAVDSGGIAGREYDISKSGSVFTNFPDLANLPNNTGCGVNTGNNNFGLTGGSGDFAISPHMTPSASTGNGTGSTGQTCDPNQTPPTGYSCTGNCAYQGSYLQCTLVSTITPPPPGVTVAQPGCYTGGALKQIFSLEWLLCPMLSMADYAVSEFDGLIQGMLVFDTPKYLCGGAAVADCTKQTNGTYHAWSIMRDVASGFLVLIMLVIVISQAVSRE